MKKLKKLFLPVVAALSFVLLLCPCLGNAAPVSVSAEASETRGLLTRLTLTSGGGDGIVWAKVKNNFTLFPSVIIVYLELYSSYEYTEDYTEMTCVKRVMIADLNQGETLETSAPTNGEQKYWCARMNYKFDQRDWAEKFTPIFLRDAAGNLVEG